MIYDQYLYLFVVAVFLLSCITFGICPSLLFLLFFLLLIWLKFTSLTSMFLPCLSVTQLLERISEVVEQNHLFTSDRPSLGEELESLQQHLESLSSAQGPLESHYNTSHGQKTHRHTLHALAFIIVHVFMQITNYKQISTLVKHRCSYCQIWWQVNSFQTSDWMLFKVVELWLA